MLTPDDVPIDMALGTSERTGGGDSARPFIPQRGSGERPALLPSQRPDRPSRYESDLADAEAAAVHRKAFEIRRPMSDLLLRWLVVLVPLALAALAGLIGVAFQKHAELFRDNGLSVDTASHLNRVRDLTASMGAIGVLGLVAMALWSGLIVTNTNRVAHSLRTPWFAAAGWLIAPGFGLIAHLTLDRRLESGSLVGLTVFLAVLYLPFGTLGGAADDLGGTPHIARTWFIASVIGAFLLIVGMSGATTVLPVDNPQHVLRIRAFACYLSALMLLASAALAFATAQNLNALISHRWALEDDPDSVNNDPKRLKISRSGRKLRRRLTPTLFLRVLVTVGLLGTGLASVGILFVLRGRYLGSAATAAERADALDDFRTMSIVVGAVSVAVHVVYIVWAVVAARNAHRRSIMAPNPFAVFASFVAGPVIIIATRVFALTGPFGAAVLTIGIVITVAGFVVGQLVLGRTVSALGGRGRIFLVWMIVDVAMSLFAAFVSANSTNRIQIVAFGVAQTAMAMLGAGMAWTAMTRLDRACRGYRHSGAVAGESGSSFLPPAPQPIPVGGPVGGGAQSATAPGVLAPPSMAPPSMALTSSQS